MKLFIKNKKKFSGFTLVELIVSIMIISVMTFTLYGNYRAVNKFVSYSTAVSDFASQIKEVQIFGASRGGTTSKGDGIYIATSTPYSYYLFSDNINSSSSTTGIGMSNLRWDGASLEPTSTKAFLNTAYLTRICYNNAEDYGSTSAIPVFTCNIPNLMLVFSRPKLNASIAYVNSGGATTTVRQACIEMIQAGVSTTTQQRSIVIRSAGQIIVQKTKCAP